MSVNVGGRPLLYTDEIIEKYADEMIEYMKIPNNIFINKFLLERGITRHRYNEWKERNTKFRHAYQQCHELQEERIKEGSLFKEFDSNMSKFLLINNHGYKDKTEATINGDIMDPLSNALNQIMDTSRGLLDGKKQ